MPRFLCAIRIILKERKSMKKIMLFVLALCLCFTTFGTAFAETAAAEKPAAEMTAEELYRAGVDAESAKDYGKALEYYKLAADLGNAESMYNLGLMYHFGQGVEQDYGKALEYYQKAADLGSVEAIHNLGVMYYFGNGVEQDYSKAYDCWLRSAEQGEPAGMFCLGECFYEGHGAEKDLDKAAEWYRKALDAGYEPDETDQAHLKEVLGDEYQQK
jgi:TPR repeat protein